jgi:hypothetical protein
LIVCLIGWKDSQLKGRQGRTSSEARGEKLVNAWALLGNPITGAGWPSRERFAHAAAVTILALQTVQEKQLLAM